MIQNSVIDVLDYQGHNIQCAKAELIYFLNNNTSQAFFHSICSLDFSNCKQALILGANVLTKEKSNTHLNKRIALHSDQMFLHQYLNAEENLRYYVNSIRDLDYIDQSTNFGNFNIDKKKLVKDLNAFEVFFLRLIICLAKNPELLIVVDPYVQVEEKKYTDFMEVIQRQIFQKKMTCFISLANQSLIDQFPGRYLTFS